MPIIEGAVAEEELGRRQLITCILGSAEVRLEMDCQGHNGGSRQRRRGLRKKLEEKTL